MADPTLTLQFQDLILRVAEFLGLSYYGPNGDQAAQVPVDAHDLDLTKRLVNDGYRQFINSRPEWQFLQPLISITFQAAYRGTFQSATATTATDSNLVQPSGVNFVGMTVGIVGGTGSGTSATITGFGAGVVTVASWSVQPDSTSRYSIAPSVCVGGDNSRYYLPDGFYGSLVSPWTYDVAGPRIRIDTCEEGTIRQLLAGASYTGQPRLVALRPLAASPTTTGKRWEAVFFPAPVASYVVTARARLYPDALVNLTDAPICGFQHEETVMAYCLAQAERQRNDTTGVQAAYAAECLQRSLALDRAASSKRLGDYGDSSDDRIGGNGRRPLSFYAVDTYNGNAV